ncbi:MAG: hypothetical protein JHD02_00100 [Thermoleophilaceae bacterium]|nr:hypothetical protein [Thermoleophilaceae bacterium]
MSGQIIFKHVTAMQRFSLAGELELFEKYGTDDRRRTIDLFQLLARAGDDVLGDGDKETLLPALEALSAIGYKREDLEDGVVPVREVGLEDYYTGTELEIFARAMHFSKDRIGDRALVMRAVYGLRWAEIAADSDVTINKARSAAKAAAGVLVRGYYASALTGCGETDAVLPRIIFGLYGDKDKKISADVERFMAHEDSCDACASVRTHLSRALTLMAAVIPPRDLTAEQSAEIMRGRSLGLAVAADFERHTGAEVEYPPEAAAASEPVTEVIEAQPAFAPEENFDVARERELRELVTAEAEAADWPGEEFLLDDAQLEEVESVSAAAILASEEAAELEAAPAAVATVGAPEPVATEAPAPVSTSLGFVDPGPAPPIDLAAIEEEEMLDDNDEDGDDLDLYASMAILEDVIDPTIVVPALIRNDELDESAPAAGEVFDWAGEVALEEERPTAEEPELAQAAEVEQIPVASADPEVVVAEQETDSPAEADSESELSISERAQAIDFAERAVPVALVLDLATEDDAELIGSVPPPIVVEEEPEKQGAPMSVLEVAPAAGAATYLTKSAPASEERDIARWVDADEDDDFDYVERDEQKDSRKKIAGVLIAAVAALLLLVGITFDGGGGGDPQVAAAPSAPAAAKPKPKKHKRKKHHKKQAKGAQPAPQPTTTYVPAAAPSNPEPAPSSSGSSGVDDGSSEFLPEERG